MTIWASKEAPGAQEYRHKRRMAAYNDFRVKKFKLLNSTVFLCILKNFLCISKVTGAMWIISLEGGSLCFSAVLWGWTSVQFLLPYSWEILIHPINTPFYIYEHLGFSFWWKQGGFLLLGCRVFILRLPWFYHIKLPCFYPWVAFVLSMDCRGFIHELPWFYQQFAVVLSLTCESKVNS